jgi:hypothetical protein
MKECAGAQGVTLPDEPRRHNMGLGISDQKVDKPATRNERRQS